MSEHYDTWTTGDGQRFIIVERRMQDNDIWIYYQLEKNPLQRYSCRADAFFERFRKEPR
jgi:hypothetical protein